MEIKKKITKLVNEGYTEAAFKKKTNADLFKKQWEKKGYVVRHLVSSGAVVEGGGKKNAHYMIATKKKKVTTKKVRATTSKVKAYTGLNFGRLRF